jgi:uncharacterized protein HemX
MKDNLVLYVLLFVVILALIGVTVFQQFEISRLYGQNRELAVSNQQKDEQNTDLRNSYSNLNSSYFQTLSSLGQLANTIGIKDSEMYSLQQDCSNLNVSYNGLLTRLDSLRNSIKELSMELGGKEGIFVLNYTYVETDVGTPPLQEYRYTATMRFYNALDNATVTVKVYGETGSSKEFTYIYQVWRCLPRKPLFFSVFSRLSKINANHHNEVEMSPDVGLLRSVFSKHT